MRSLAVAVNTATHPSTGQPIFDLGEDEMEIGMGQHGEAGTGRMQLKSADETAEIMLNMLLEDLEVKSGEEILGVRQRRRSNHPDGIVDRLPPRGPAPDRQRKSSWCAAQWGSSSPPRNRPVFKC